MQAMSAWHPLETGGFYRSRKRFAVGVQHHPVYGWWTIRVLNPNGKEIERQDIDATERGAKCAATRALRKHAP